MTWHHRYWKGLIYFFVLTWCALFVSIGFRPDMPSHHDSGVYMVFAKNLAEGKGYQDPASPVPNTGMIRVPSAFPILLAPYWRVLHPHLEWLKVFHAALLSCGVALAFAWLQRYLSFLPALFLSMAIGSSTAFVTIANSLLTEALFFPLLYGGMLLESRTREVEDGRRKTVHSWLSLVCWVIVARTRVIGILFLSAFLVTRAKKKQWVPVLCGIFLFTSWYMWERVLGGNLSPHEYTDGLLNRKFPVLVDPMQGFTMLWNNCSHNLWSYTGSMHAKTLFPYFYDLVAMNPFKRLLVLSVFAWSMVGAVLLWKRHSELRPWLLAGLLSLVPTFLFFIPEDLIRYMFPYFPFFLLTLVFPIQELAPVLSFRRTHYASLGVSVLLLLSQAAHTPKAHLYLYREEQDNFLKLHDHIRTMEKQPKLLLSPDRYYSYLKTGLPALALHRIRERPLVIAVQSQGEVWALCGPGSHNTCRYLEAYGQIPETPPLYKAGSWFLYRINPAE